MNTPRRLILFDVDGTLVDSQSSIVSAMVAAFSALGLPVPARAAILSIVGLPLEHAMARLAPDQCAARQAALVRAYKEAFFALREQSGAAPLYPGAREMLARLHAVPENLLGVATGKSRRGLAAVLDAHGLGRFFVTRQVADDHPSKPHPSMIEAAMAQTGMGPRATAMIGDTSFDMEMAQAAGIAAIGVSWGYHDVPALAAADCVVDRFGDLPAALGRVWEVGR